ncbi:MAG: beta-ketoacyl synthase N-terminal-like domain-containing protein, partial [Elusimicrobiota bacterium]
DKLFREHNLDEILAGKNMIEPIPAGWRAKQIDKNIMRVIKSPTGNHSIEKIESVDQAIKLSARSGRLDIEKEFGLPNTVAKALDTTFKMAIGAGVLALKDAGLPLIHYYKKTTTGGWLPEKWALPEPVASETGVIFASAFPVMESLLKEVTHYFNYKYSGRTAEQLWEVYHRIVDKLPAESDKAALRAWLQGNFSDYRPGAHRDPYTFSQNFLLKVIPIADSQFAQWVGARGPSIHVNAACASTTQAVHLAESWIRAGKCKRVVVIGADDITSEIVQEWTLPGFLASGTATTAENVSEAALPFDRRRHGLIVGAAAVAMVIEDETLTRGRGMKPLARLLLTECANSAFHVTRLDTDHVASVMEKFVAKAENIYGLKKEEMAPHTMFMSHETYTPARGGSASAEVKALKKAFGACADKVVVSNVKGFTGHSMGASLEDVIAIRALNTGIIPPIANYREPDPELAGINLSKGGRYDLKYALRFAAGFGSHMAMSLTERVWKEGESRYENQTRYQDWVKEVSGDTSAELEVVFNTLRVKDRKTAGFRTPVPVREPVGVTAASALKSVNPETQTVTRLTEPKPVSATASEPSSIIPPPSSLSENSIRAEILTMIADKTGYPKDMLELDLDMEADLGIDTVKQAELFAAIREHYAIPRKDNISLKDYPTIRHCIRFVMDETGAAVRQQDSTTVKEESPQGRVAALPDSIQPELIDLTAKPAERPAEKQSRHEHPRRHIRHVPVIIQAPVEQEVIKKLSPKRPVAIFAEDLDLARAFRAELNKHRADSYIFTMAKTKMKDAITVDFKDIPALEKALVGFAAAHPDTQGIVYLPGCMVKSLSLETAATEDLKRYALPLFLAAKHLGAGLAKADPGHTTFLAVVTTLDGGFGYKTRDAYDPIYGAIYGPTLCLRKEFERSAVKLLDFEPSSSNQTIVQKTFYEILYSDKRLAIGYADGKRWTLVGKPQTLDTSRQTTPLEGKTVLITGGGRGLGALFSRMLAEQHRPNLALLDIIDLNDKAKRLTAMSPEELKAYKTGELWAGIKAAAEKPTPAMLEREFTKLKDAAYMHNNQEAIRALGGK